jgi:DNA polymerase
MPPTVIELRDETDLDGFRAACRRLVAARVPPEAVQWRPRGSPGSERFAGEPQATPEAAGGTEGAQVPGPTTGDDTAAAPPVRAPAFFLELCTYAVLHRDPGRFGLLYRLLWRLQREPALRHDGLDADRVGAERLVQAVRHDLQRMKSSVRFRSVADGSELPAIALDAEAAADDAGIQPLTADLATGAPLAGPWHVAWYEPEHHIVEAVAPSFVRRHTQVRWALLTPGRSARWDGRTLAFGAGARPEDLPAAGAGEGVWLSYCGGLFDPARSDAMVIRDGIPARRNTRAPTEPNQPDPAIEQPVSLTDLAQAIDRCRECPLGALATRGVPGEGPKRGARLMFVGEQPGDQEDLRGRPFVGPAGQLLDRAFKELGWPREKVYVTNAVKHFKFELRGMRRIHKTPAQQEMAACLHWLESEIEIVQPEALVALGATAARQLMGTAVGVLRERGHWLKRGDGKRVLITLHPSALLRADPEDRDAAYAAWLSDLRAADLYFRDA